MSANNDDIQNMHSVIDTIYDKDIEAYWEGTYVYGMDGKTTFVRWLLSGAKRAIAKLPHQFCQPISR